MVRQLVERIRQKDQRAMRQLYEHYIGQLSSVCYRYVPSESDAKDVLQNSFIKIFTSIPSIEYRDEPSFRSWMTRVVVNEALHFLRDQKRLQLVEISSPVAEQIIDEEEPDIIGVSADELHRLISELPDGYRMVVNLYVFEGYSHKKIAELLSIKENTSASQLYYAKQLLARRIKELKGK